MIIELYSYGKYPKKCCLATIKTVFKIQKMSEEQISAIQKEEEEWKTSPEYESWKKKYDEREDEDIFKYDPDPKGYQGLFNARDQTNQAGVVIAKKVSNA